MLAFVRGWTPGGDADAIRAQLRGLGAILFVVSDAGVWSFRRDDDVELSARSSPRLAREIEDLGARFGVPSGDDGVFVVDGDGVVRFARAPSADLSATGRRARRGRAPAAGVAAAARLIQRHVTAHYAIVSRTRSATHCLALTNTKLEDCASAP